LDLWLLAGLSALGWRRASGTGRLVALGGLAVLLAFQVEARADFDFWKHSIYAVFFLAPLAALTWLELPLNTGTWRVVTLGAGAWVLVWLVPRAELNAQQSVAYYPNLNPSLSAIQSYVEKSPEVLMDDTALRYYLYGRMPVDAMVGPFLLNYQGLQGVDAYRRAVDDRWFGAIVLDGGDTPQGMALDQAIAADLAQNYVRVYAGDAGNGYTVHIYTPIPPPPGSANGEPSGPWPVDYRFDTGTAGWGAHPENGRVQPGDQVTTLMEPSLAGQPVLRFTVSDSASTVATLYSGYVKALRARVNVQSPEGNAPVRVGFVAFDQDWQWHDDGFRYLVTPGVWTTLSWALPEPGHYQEVGLKFPANVQVADLSEFEVDPSN
jgi:hypothetical protein